MTTTSREDYLKHIFILQQESKDAVPMGALASVMGVASASVTGMVKSLVDSGFVMYEPYVGVSLTHAGEKIALDVIRRHRLIEAFLVSTLGLDWSEVHEEAEAMEHVISDKLLARIDLFLGNPKVDPHGDPIPAANGKVNRTKLKNLAEQGAGTRVRVVRVLDQDAKFLQFVDRIGLRPGAELLVETNDTESQVITVKCESAASVMLANTAAAKLLVEPC